MTPLDTAFAAMMADPEDVGARLAYYARLADGELYVLLETEAEGEVLSPRVFPLDSGPVVLAFDREERLAEFTTIPAPYAALPGRVLVRMLAGQGDAPRLGLGVNLGTETAWIVTPEALDWLAETLDHAPQPAEARPLVFRAPFGLPRALMEALDAKLARAGGLASGAVLAAADYEGGGRGHMLAFLDAAGGAEAALAQAVAEALAFSGLEAGQIDVTFLPAAAPAAQAMLRHGLRIDLPEPPAQPEPRAPAAPGMDPDKPPRLK